MSVIIGKKLKESAAVALATLSALTPAMLTRIGTAAAGAALTGAALTAAKPAQAALNYGYHDLGSGYGIIVVPSYEARTLVLLAKGGAAAGVRLLLAKWGVWPPVAFALATFGIGHLIWLAARIIYCSYQADRVYLYVRHGIPLGADPGR